MTLKCPCLVNCASAHLCLSFILFYFIFYRAEEELEASPADGAENTDPAITAAVALTEEQALAEAAATAEANARQVALQEEEDDQGERGGVVGGDSLLTGSEELAPNEIDQLFG